ncbi:hypothetical protein CHS0354_042251 [Potamilus streckersoni]|uniref:Transcription initiation factor IIE subunit beta n=1 Tax=Potamilus streckersoni TaxID=2493646 RepID=A0AAE0W0V3_9BIVA|nr:hypothetical protein CHS0354_042251 [Potamilus streckersoni]
MDPELLREREAFKKRALAQPTVEKRKKPKDENNEKAAKKQKLSSKPQNSNDDLTSSSSSASRSFDYKTAQGSSQYKFSILTKIVKHLKTKHQEGDSYGLEIDEILDETNLLDIGSKNKHWLITEALVNNPKVRVIEEDGMKKYAFLPKYKIRDKKGLLNLLKNQDLHGYGGILMDDIEESLPNMLKVLKQLDKQITYVTRPSDKKKVLFYNDRYCQFIVDEEFQKQWRAVSVEGQDERKIEEYLEKQGIKSMQDIGIRKIVHVQKRKKGNKHKNFKKHNEHLDGVLEDYSEITNKRT